MLASDILLTYTKNHPIIDKISFSKTNGCNEQLPSIFVMTQNIIDALISNGETRIIIIMPDSECTILPMIAVKLIDCLLNDKKYTEFEIDKKFNIGEKMKIGTAVVEYLGRSQNNGQECLTIRTGKSRNGHRLDGPIEVTAPIDLFPYFDKTNSQKFSPYETYVEQKQLLIKRVDEEGFIKKLQIVKTHSKKTMCLLSSQTKFIDDTESISINKCNTEDLFLVGQIEEDGIAELKNKGKLAGIPTLAYTSSLYNLKCFISKFEKQINFIYADISKFDEILNHLQYFDACLKASIPFMVFARESEFKDIPKFIERDFKLWHWKPSSLQSESFLIETTVKRQLIFGKILKKTATAALSSERKIICSSGVLRKTIGQINSLTKDIDNLPVRLQKIAKLLWELQQRLNSILIPLVGLEKEGLLAELDSIKSLIKSCRVYHSGQECYVVVESICEELSTYFKVSQNKTKADKLSEILSSCTNVIIIVPDKYQYIEQTLRYCAKIVNGKQSIRVSRVSEFLANENQVANEIILSSWLGKSLSLSVKCSYRYDHLIYLLYDFEASWQQSFGKYFEQCIPSKSTKDNSELAGLGSCDFYDNTVIDNLTEDWVEDKVDEISNFEVPLRITSAINKSRFAEYQSNSANTIEALPIILLGEKIVFFVPEHEIIDVTAVMKAEDERSRKKEAKKLLPGDILIIRQSGKDIIREAADNLLSKDNKLDLRKIAVKWRVALLEYSDKNGIRDIATIKERLQLNGCDKSEQVIKYWINDEDIIGPRSLSDIIAIAKTTEDDELFNSANEVFDAISNLRGYHISAGSKLTKELRKNMLEIKSLKQSGAAIPKLCIEGIGEVLLYTVDTVGELISIDRAKINKVEDLN